MGFGSVNPQPTRCIGGPLDGREVDTVAFEVLFPFTDAAWSQAALAWQEEFGVAYAVCQAWNKPWNGPPQPSFPQYRYLRTEAGFEYRGEIRD